MEPHPGVRALPSGGGAGEHVRGGLQVSGPGLAVGHQPLPDWLLSPLPHSLHSQPRQMNLQPNDL